MRLILQVLFFIFPLYGIGQNGHFEVHPINFSELPIQPIKNISGDYLFSTFEITPSSFFLIGSFPQGPKIISLDRNRHSVQFEIPLDCLPKLSFLRDSSIFILSWDNEIFEYNVKNRKKISNFTAPKELRAIRLIVKDDFFNIWLSNGNTYTLNTQNEESEITKGWTFDNQTFTFINKFYENHDNKSFQAVITNQNGTREILLKNDQEIGTINYIGSELFIVETIEESNPLKVSRSLWTSEGDIKEIPTNTHFKIRNDVKVYEYGTFGVATDQKALNILIFNEVTD
ncbi:MAG: hypothetical protein MRY83_19435 [Flavobacteriales bacterium]|nr:hypothetical protein [Flavobacteriales bacterium]